MMTRDDAKLMFANDNGNYVANSNKINKIFDDFDAEINNMKSERHQMASCMLSILDSIKLFDKNSLDLSDETLSEVFFRKMKGYNIDLNKELGFTHLCPVTIMKF